MADSRTKEREQYRGLLKEGYNREKITPFVNTLNSSEEGVKTRPYNEWSKEELYQLAVKAGIPGRSYMNKKSLINSLQNN